MKPKEKSKEQLAWESNRDMATDSLMKAKISIELNEAILRVALENLRDIKANKNPIAN